MNPASAPLAALFLVAQTGVASTSSTSTVGARLEVRADQDCTSRGDLVGRVAARAPSIHFVEDEGAFVIRADFSVARSGNVTGELLLLGPGGKPSSRRLLARSCAEAADAVALIIAVTLDPTATPDGRAARTGAAVTSAATSPTVGSSPSSQPSAASQGAVSPQRPAPPEARPLPVSQQDASSTERGGTPPSLRRFGAYLAGQTIWGPAPAVMPGIALSASAALDRDAVWSPAVLAGFGHNWTTGLGEPGGTASFMLDAIEVDGCMLRWRVSRLEARACASALMGLLSSRGQGAPQSTSATAPSPRSVPPRP